MQFHKPVKKKEPNAEVVDALYNMAISGRNPSATMFWLRCRAGWKPTPENEFGGDDVEMVFSSCSESEEL